ncbi:MAG: threonine synthase [Verrucomicrobia bacterium]|nr:threonine synthase [Verrucomicrobiota bacterium]
MVSQTLFYSTNGQAPLANLREALLRGQAPDRGLYMPVEIPRLPREEIAAMANLPYHEIALTVLRHYTTGVVDETKLSALCKDAYQFDVPLEHVGQHTWVMRLDRGPTASFKDFAARLMARMLGLFVVQENRPLTILTATSGDTGSAVASAFAGVPGIRVVVLFPEHEVSRLQRKQMTTLGGNIRTVAVAGKFDDCQAMVKRAFADPSLGHLSLTSANSINIGRLLPQIVYYYYAASRVAEPGASLVFSVPSGNFGNMMGAVLGWRMGLPIKRLVVAVNANDEFPRMLKTGTYEKIEPSRHCLSNAMNVGHPSNLARLVALYGGRMDETGVLGSKPDFDAMRKDIFSTSVSDEQTRETIKFTWTQHRLLLEPHGAVAWRGFEEYLSIEPPDRSPVVVLETAHPAKFPEEIQRCLGFSPDPPPCLRAVENLPEQFDRLPSDQNVFREYLLDTFGPHV